MKARFRRQNLRIAVVLLGAILSLSLFSIYRAAAAVHPNPVIATWERVRAAGTYHFSTDVVQVTTPAATVTNVGCPATEQRMHLEGQTDLHQQTMHMYFWTGSGSVAQPESAVQVRVADGQTFARHNGSDWQAVSAVTDGMAPQGDFLSYLAAVRDVAAHEPEMRAGITFTRYTFRLDGPAFADFMRIQTERRLTELGELPPGVHLESPDFYTTMTGQGELWVAENGLPLRQILQLTFPERNAEQVTAEITVTFSQFGTLSDWSLLTNLLPGPDTFVAFLLVLGCTWGLIRFRRSRLLGTSLAVLLVGIMVLEPLLMNLRLVDFATSQAAQAAEQETQQQEQAAMAEFRAAQVEARQAHDPHANPLDALQPDAMAATGGSFAPATNVFASGSLTDPASSLAAPLLQQTSPRNVPDRDGDGLSDQDETEVYGTRPNIIDTDNDGLSDYVEVHIGTDPLRADTDGDGLSDAEEVNGFTHAGQRWYPNPEEMDSNGDGLGDGQEWLAMSLDAAMPLDTDNDGTPDLFDADNDGDGVPDRLDMASMERVGPFSEANPFRLIIENLTPGEPTLVDFQLRPQNPDHIWYAQHVLDWPQDRAGQLQDTDGVTFADAARSAGRMPEPNESFGDMKLVPMLEIRINDTANQLPSEEELEEYGIGVSDLDENGNGKVAYVPLSVVNDDDTGAKVAFQGRMFYRPGAVWGLAHEVRLLWFVRMLMDDCDQAQDGQCSVYMQLNQERGAHSYYDDWTLTGLTVTEDRGAAVAVIYEDPTVDSNLRDDEALWLLANGLDNTYLSPRMRAGTQERDITIPELVRRFNHTTNSSVSEEERWGIPNILRVETPDAPYETLDMATMDIATDKTRSILNRVFASRWNQDRTLMPLLMYTIENTRRTVSLDGLMDAGTGYLTLSNRTLRVNFDPGSQPPVALDTLATVKWSPYCADRLSGTMPDWQICATEDYLDELEQRYDDNAFREEQEDDTETTIAGQRFLLQFYFLAVLNGVTEQVETNNRVQISTFRPMLTDPEQFSTVRGILNGTRAGVVAVVNRFLLRAIELADQTLINPTITFGNFIEVLGELWRDLRNLNTSKAQNALDDITRNLIGFDALTLGGILAVGLVVGSLIVAGLVVAFVVGDERAQMITVNALLVAFTLGVQVILPLITAAQNLKKAGISFIQLVFANAAAAGVTAQAGVIGAILSIGVSAILFIISAIALGAPAFSPELNALFAQFLAEVIFAVIMAALSATVVGLILVGLVALVDAILALVCAIDEDRLAQVDGACFSLNRFAVKVIASLIYSFASMIDSDRDDLVATGPFNFMLDDPEKGYQEGNPLAISFAMTTTVVHQDPAPENWFHITPYLAFFSRSNLRSTTFRTTVTRGTRLPAEELEVERGEMRDDWQNVEVDHTFRLLGIIPKDMYRADYTDPEVVLTDIELSAGIDQPINLYNNTAYALPAFECFTLPVPSPIPVPTGYLPVPICYTRTIDGSTSNRFNPIEFDIFPATFTEFIETADAGDGGQRLAWDERFPSQRDADGDGLISSAYNGMDPNELTWDGDGDGLSDAFELERRAEGVNYSPVALDTDGDGLSDAQETQLGTNPAARDTDRDGLTDAQEVYHQVLVEGYRDINDNPVAVGQWSGGWMVTVRDLAPGASATREVLAVSDPTVLDTDGDGLSDLAEFQLADAGFEYHPQAADQPPLNMVVATDDVDGFVRPGQALVYTTTTQVDIDPAFFAPGVREDSIPSVVGGAGVTTEAYDLRQELVRQFDLRVQPNTGTQQVELSSAVRAHRTITGPEWRWSNRNQAGPGGFSRPAFGVRLDAAQPDRSDSYLLATLVREANAFPAGDIRVSGVGQSIGNTTVDTDDASVFNQPGFTGPYGPDDRFRRGTEPADIACNTAGNCFIVWEHFDNCRVVQIETIEVVRAASDPNGGIEPFLSLQRDSTQVRTLPGNNEQIWSVGSGPSGRPDMRQGQIRSGSQFGLPVQRTFCGTARIVVEEADGGLQDPDELVGTITVAPLTRQGQQSTLVTGSGHQIRVTYSVLANHQYRVSGALVSGSNANSIVRSQEQLSVLSSGLTGPIEIQDYRPAVASDGRGFVAVWERHYLDNNNRITRAEIVSRAFNASGAPGLERVISTSNGPFFSARTHLDVVWTNLGYRVAWLGTTNLVVTPGDRSLLVHAMLQADGSLLPATRSNPAALVGSLQLSAGLESAPSLSYDPYTDTSLLAYRDNTGRIQLRLSALSVVNGRLVENVQRTRGIGDPSTYPAVAYNPAARVWMLLERTSTAQSRILEFTPDLNNFRTSGPETFTWAQATTSGAGLACPAPGAVPAFELPLEERPGVTNFTDVRGGITLTCFGGPNCPTAGTVGAAPPSGSQRDNEYGERVLPPNETAFAIRFDGQSDLLFTNNQQMRQLFTNDFTIAFWINTTQQLTIAPDAPATAGIPLFQVDTANQNVRIALANNSILFGIGNRTIRNSTVNIADGRWHSVIATRNRNSTLELYVDGRRVAGTGAPTTSLTPINIFVGGLGGPQDFAGRLDQLTVYTSALRQNTVNALLAGEIQSYCQAAAPAGATQIMRQFTVQPRDRSTVLFEGRDTLVLTVDPEAPTSTFDSVADGGYIRGGTGTNPNVLLGGNAQDGNPVSNSVPSSGIAQIDVSVNNGPFQPAIGRETWTFSLSSDEGIYSIRTRATDAVGHVENPGSGKTIIVDATPPQATVNNTANRSSLPTRNRDGQWFVSLSGTINDPAIGNQPGSGLVPESVEVLLRGQFNAFEGVIEGNGWQRATVNGNTWTITYAMVPDIPDPTGRYEIMVRAADRVGNRIADDTVQATIQVDASGPVAALTIEDATTVVITGTITLNGTISDTVGLATGIEALEAAFVPIDQLVPLSGTALLLPLDERSGSEWFNDQSEQQQDARCIAAGNTPCPVAGEPGRIDRAVRFTGQSHLRVANTASLSFDEAKSFSVQVWVQPDANAPARVHRLLNKSSGEQTGYQLWRDNSAGGAIRFRIGRQTLTAPNVSGGAWSHIVGVVDRTAGMAYLYINGMLQASMALTAEATTFDTSDFELGGWRVQSGEGFVGWLDEVRIIKSALSAEDVQSLFQSADRPWYPATLDQAGDGVSSSTWRLVVPADLDENLYQIDMRATDMLGNRTLSPYVWRGMIDTQSPRVTITAQPTGNQYFNVAANAEQYEIDYACSADDLFLEDRTYDCPCNGQSQPERSYLQAGWWSELFSDTSRITRLSSTCTLWEPTPEPVATARVCDLPGNCTEATSQPANALLAASAQAADPNLPLAVVADPTQGQVVAADGTFSVTVNAEGPQPLRTVELLVDGSVVDTASFVQADNITNTRRTIAVSPGSEGTYTLVARATDWAGNAQADLAPITITLDTQLPQLTLSTSALTTSSILQPGSGIVRLTGTATDTVGVGVVQVRLGEQAFSDTEFDGTTWKTSFYLGEEPDGKLITGTARVIDLAGRIAAINKQVMVDVVEPAPVDTTMSYRNSQGNIVPLERGDAITDTPSPTLILEWTASSDGSGLQPYLAGWTTSAIADPAAFTSTTALRHEQAVGDRQVYYAHLIVRDTLGNEWRDTVGPVYIDGRLTPDLVADLDYAGWLDSGCTLIGVDRREARRVADGGMRSAGQQLYATWDEQALRLAWTGANWTMDGDLFIYLDTGPGGSSQVYNPFDANTRPAMLLPLREGTQADADYLIWVQDDQVARLLRWTGSTWEPVANATLRYQFDAQSPYRTNLYLPFSQVGLTRGSSLSLVALASRENRLEVWATMPNTNPLVQDDNPLRTDQPVKLTQKYVWKTLGSGQCPNAGTFSDADLLLDMQSTPPGATISYLGDNLAARLDLASLEAIQNSPAQEEQQSVAILKGIKEAMQVETQAVQYGQTMTYTLRYTNDGTETARNARIVLRAWGPVALRDAQGNSTGRREIPLGDLAPGAAANITFQAVVSQRPDNPNGAIEHLGISAYIANAERGLFDWLLTAHSVDSQPPTNVGITTSTTGTLVVRSGLNMLRGTAIDQSGVPEVTLLLRPLPDGTVQEVGCANPTPFDGTWACPLEIPAEAASGDEFELRVRSTDGRGLSASSDPITLTVSEFLYLPDLRQ